MIQSEPSYLDAYLLLGEIYEERHDFPAAAAVYRDALKIEQLPPSLRRQLAEKVRAIESHRQQGEGRSIGISGVGVAVVLPHAGRQHNFRPNKRPATKKPQKTPKG